MQPTNEKPASNTICKCCGEPASGSICGNCGWDLTVIIDPPTSSEATLTPTNSDPTPPVVPESQFSKPPIPYDQCTLTSVSTNRESISIDGQLFGYVHHDRDGRPCSLIIPVDQEAGIAYDVIGFDPTRPNLKLSEIIILDYLKRHPDLQVTNVSPQQTNLYLTELTTSLDTHISLNTPDRSTQDYGYISISKTTGFVPDSNLNLTVFLPGPTDNLRFEKLN